MIFHLFFFQSLDWIQLVQSLGFPIVVAGALMFFAYRVWVYAARKLDEKDAQIATMIEREETAHQQLVETQEKITETQNRIIDTQNQIVDLIKRISK